MYQKCTLDILKKTKGVSSTPFLVPCGPAMLSRRKLSGDPPETLRGGSPDILAKITGKSRQNFQKKFFFAFFLKILSGFASDLAKKSGDPPGGSPGGLRTISAGTTLMVHTVCNFVPLSWKLQKPPDPSEWCYACTLDVLNKFSTQNLHILWSFFYSML